MNANHTELTLDEARARLGDVVDRAARTGQITYVTKDGQRVAAIVPTERIGRAADISLSLTSVDVIAEETGASIEDVRAVIEHISALDIGESIATIDDSNLVGMETVALYAVYERLGRVIRFVRSRQACEPDTVTFTIAGLDITETSVVDGTTHTRTDTGANLRDVDEYLNARATDLTAEGFHEDVPTPRDRS